MHVGISGAGQLFAFGEHPFTHIGVVCRPICSYSDLLMKLFFLSQPISVGSCGDREKTEGSQGREREAAQREGESPAMGNAR